MGTNARLISKETGKKIDCDRLYNLNNEFTQDWLSYDYISKYGVPCYMLIDMLQDLAGLLLTLNHNSKVDFYEGLIQELKEFNAHDYFTLVSDADERYWD